VISHLPIIHCQHDARISNQTRVISQCTVTILSQPIQKMSQGHNHNESWDRMIPASLSVHRTLHLSPYQRRSLSTDPGLCLLPLILADDVCSFSPGRQNLPGGQRTTTKNGSMLVAREDGTATDSTDKFPPGAVVPSSATTTMTRSVSTILQHEQERP
jgi:hypothetical protein